MFWDALQHISEVTCEEGTWNPKGGQCKIGLCFSRARIITTISIIQDRILPHKYGVDILSSPEIFIILNLGPFILDTTLFVMMMFSFGKGNLNNVEVSLPVKMFRYVHDIDPQLPNLYHDRKEPVISLIHSQSTDTLPDKQGTLL